jgi:sugar lactone lactonase YvrE
MRHSQFNTLILFITILSLFACSSAYSSDIYVTTNSNVIQKIDSGGNKTTFVTTTSLPSFLNFDRNGYLYAAYDYAGIIEKFDSSGHKTIVATGLTLPQNPQLGPEGLAFDSAGNLYTAIMNQGMVLKIDPSGNKTVFASGLNLPDGLAFDGSGNLYVSSYGDNKIWKFDPSANKSTFASGISGLECLAFDSQGYLYASRDNILNKGSILKFDQTGAYSVFASSTYLNSPFELAFDGSDNLYAACMGGPYGLVKLDTSGNISTVANAPSVALGVAIQIPEPCTLLLLGLGMAIIRKRKA